MLKKTLFAVAAMFAIALSVTGTHADVVSGKPAMKTTGTLTLSNIWLRFTPPGAKVGAGYLTITNNGTKTDRLIAVKSTIAKKNEIHEMAMDKDIMIMRPVADGITIEPGQSVDLKPGGFHLMLMGLTEPLAEGDIHKLTLVFEIAGDIEIEMPVLKKASGHQM